MMKVFIKRNPQSKHGLDLVEMNDDVIVKTIELTSKTTDGYIHIPKEYWEKFNRRLVKIANIGESYELTWYDRAQRQSSEQTTTPTTKSNIEEDATEYLTEDEASTFKKLLAKIEKAKMRAKLEAEIAKLEELKKQYEEEVNNND